MKTRTSGVLNERAAEESINGSKICVGRQTATEHLKTEVPVKSDGIVFWFFNHL